MPEETDWYQTGPKNWFRRYPEGYASVGKYLGADSWHYSVWRTFPSGLSFEIRYGGGRPADRMNLSAEDAMMAADRAYEYETALILPEFNSVRGHQAQLRIAEYRRPR